MSATEQTSTQKIITNDLWIGGEAVPASTHAYFDDLNPESDRVYSHAADGAVEDIDRAVTSAHTAFAASGLIQMRDRERWLMTAAEVFEGRREQFVDVLVDEVGSPIFKANFEFDMALSAIRAAAGVPRRLKGETLPSDRPGAFSVTVREPVGVVAGITPFNVPLLKGAKQGSMALATGNCFVQLPSEHAPRVAHMLARVFQDAGFPDGHFNVVTGNPFDIGDALTEHHLVKCVTFCGSSRIGRHVAELCARHYKPVILELGGKSPMIVLDDADLDSAVQAAAISVFFFQGQACMAASRLLVQRGAAQEFADRLAAVATDLTARGMGDLRNDDTVVGPTISKRQRERVTAHVEDAVAKGAEVCAGGRWRDNRFEPTVLRGVRPEMTVYTEETFGPVTSIYAFDDLQDAVDRANDTEYGLSGSVFTQDVTTALSLAKAVRTGMIHINAPSIQDEPHVPFGGLGRSGIGREGTETDADAMTQWKWITVQLPPDGGLPA
ncbi:Benzaldehyde dehydrogenase YfmT [Capillimicrobium parvum]|uniref:Benzaldehyde dehydrogenase YfmT n=1 Tax=Capillimicrobium parvum TaxID=2884022 RepID=A0A9E7C0W8_9ACTN|nr:Benzaldehyde dehydrogenase YfmT [Capillimicrobium parvum]